MGDVDEIFARVARRYRAVGRGVAGYVGGKLRRDPVHRDVLARAGSQGFGEVIDVGSGRGQMALALLEAGVARSVLGLDRGAAHLEQARLASQGLSFRARTQDFAREPALPSADTILMIDVLYQLDPASQAALLHHAAGAARQTVLIRTPDLTQGWRGAITMAFERLARFVSPHSGLHVRPPPVERLRRELTGRGFAVEVTPCWRGTPFANVLLTARRDGQPAV